jgi:hypothetical protein
MKLKIISRVVGFASLSLFAAIGCGSSNNKTPGTGGTTGTAGSSSAGTTGSAGHAGTSGGGAGTTGSGGATGTGGGGAAIGSLCTGVMPPADKLISDFSAGNTTFGAFGSGEHVTGGTYDSGNDTYLVQDFGNSNWHLTGVAYGQQSYFGIYWTCDNATSGGCTLDVSRYAGVTFTIKADPTKGGVGPSNKIGFSIGRREDDTLGENDPAHCGTCMTNMTPTSLECHGPRVDVSVPSDGSTATVTLLWSDFAGGAPVPGLSNTALLTGIIWYFHDLPADAGVPDGGGMAGASGSDGGPTGTFYPVDVTIDDIKFITSANDGGSGG